MVVASGIKFIIVVTGKNFMVVTSDIKCMITNRFGNKFSSSVKYIYTHIHT